MEWLFYHYTNPIKDKLKRLEHVVESRVYFPRPSELNDELDCRPKMEVAGEAQLLAWVNKRGADRFPRKSQLKERRERKDAALRRYRDKNWLTKKWASNVEHNGILSLSKSKCNLHMWEKYAAKGTGVCIEYDFEPVVEQRAVDWVFFGVTYDDEQPSLNLLDYQKGTIGANREFSKRSFGTKTRKWMAEEEVRVIADVKGVHGQKIPAPPGVIKTLILGPSISDEDRNTILSWSSSVELLQPMLNDEGVINGFKKISDSRR